jgi:hypothetical protein
MQLSIAMETPESLMSRQMTAGRGEHVRSGRACKDPEQADPNSRLERWTGW